MPPNVKEELDLTFVTVILSFTVLVNSSNYWNNLNESEIKQKGEENQKNLREYKFVLFTSIQLNYYT